MQRTAWVILPDAAEPGPYAVLYLLHGLSDDHTIWMRRTSIERYVSGLPLIVVMPDGGRSFYVNAVDGPAYETAMVDDLVNTIDRFFPTRAERGGRCLAGLSMGGYGAFRLALGNPTRYCSAVSHSGALGYGHWAPGGDPEWAHEARRILGPDPAGGPNDLFALAGQVSPELLPALRFDCGTDDFLLDSNRAFHAHLETLGTPHTYAEYPGDHNWEYWDLHVQEAISFHAERLGIAR